LADHFVIPSGDNLYEQLKLIKLATIEFLPEGLGNKKIPKLSHESILELTTPLKNSSLAHIKFQKVLQHIPLLILKPIQSTFINNGIKTDHLVLLQFSFD
jgi:hypothetical protein